MSVTITALREKILNFSTQAKNLLADKGDQAWSKEDQDKFDGFTNEIEGAKAHIKAIEKQRENEADSFFNSAEKPQGKEMTIDALAAMAIYMRQGSNVTAEQAIAIKNAMSTTTQSEGGFTVPTEVATMVIDKLKAYGGMRDVATILTTAGGNPMNWPTSDGTAEVGAIVGQNAAAPLGEMSFGTIGLNPFYYTSNKIALPLELIQDSAIDVVAFVVNRLATRIARIQNTHFTVGGGTTLPDGIVPKAGVGKTGLTGQTLTVLYDDLVDLKHSINRAYRDKAKFMLNDLSVATLSKLKDTTGRPIWESSITVGTPDTLLGHPVVINDDVAVMAANAKSIVFGDLSNYNIRDVAGTTVIRRFDDSAFGLNNQVGFCGWMRSGGNLLEPLAVKVYVNSAT
jgi:HK97 family phage major capsid protein